MKMLAYETSGRTLSIAVLDGQKILANISSNTEARHSNALIPMIETALKKSSMSLDQVEVIAVGLGPGSFTGLRVGIATAKIFGYALKKRLVGVSGLEAMAACSGREGKIAVSIDARRSQVYGAVYEKKHGRLKILLKPSLMTQGDFMKKAEGMALLKDDKDAPTALGVALGAMAVASSGRYTDPYKLEPLYLRGRDCNVTFPKK